MEKEAGYHILHQPLAQTKWLPFSVTNQRKDTSSWHIQELKNVSSEQTLQRRGTHPRIELDLAASPVKLKAPRPRVREDRLRAGPGRVSAAQGRAELTTGTAGGCRAPTAGRKRLRAEGRLSSNRSAQVPPTPSFSGRKRGSARLSTARSGSRPPSLAEALAAASRPGARPQAPRLPPEGGSGPAGSAPSAQSCRPPADGQKPLTLLNTRESQQKSVTSCGKSTDTHFKMEEHPVERSLGENPCLYYYHLNTNITSSRYPNKVIKCQ